MKTSSVTCQYISSVAVMTPYGGFFEFGYLIGYWGPGGPCTGVSSTQYYSQPTLFNVRGKNSGQTSCTFFADRHPPEGTSQVLRASDANANNYWGSWYNADELQPNGVYLDFTAGRLYISRERGAPGDTGSAHFKEIQEHHISTGWTLTTDVRRECDYDYQWNYVAISGHEGGTATGSGGIAC